MNFEGIEFAPEEYWVSFAWESWGGMCLGNLGKLELDVIFIYISYNRVLNLFEAEKFCY